MLLSKSTFVDELVAAGVDAFAAGAGAFVAGAVVVLAAGAEVVTLAGAAGAFETWVSVAALVVVTATAEEAVALLVETCVEVAAGCLVVVLLVTLATTDHFGWATACPAG